MVLATSSALSVTISRYSKTDFTFNDFDRVIAFQKHLQFLNLVHHLQCFQKELILMQDSLTSLGFANSFKF